MSKKVLIITGDAVEALEVYYPYFRVLEEGYEAVIASPKKKLLQTVVHDFEGWDTYTEKQGYRLESHLAFADVEPSDYAGLIIPGGRAPEYIRLDEHIPRILEHFLESNKPIGAICHAALVFSALPGKGYFEGRTMTAYSACKFDVENIGASYTSETLHLDGNLVSGHAWPDLPGFMREFLKLLR
ncbi:MULTISPECIES: DJ-1/PfpI family protein [unclassified Paenibacillus]|uniref:DJ-1/PfpI family protein n=1 Tax=unclassified Paenibacillus TaxID=185978 RepID=UPI001C10B033|nr:MULTISPECIES: DJ-1/PfpI family protein [unclassified Paenibacillus]MBU5440765.1 DJ-1/PfpI family protein [Paenibacillus sp. MSJ-34]CAH0120379.1 Putative cysteine protease YraA [Paenibacillus sp. CECT 9249]